MRFVTLAACLVSLWLGLLADPISAANGGGRAAFDKAIASAKTAMMADPQDALKKTDAALKQADSLVGNDRNLARATALWLKIEANIFLNRLDVAQVHLDEALALAKIYAANSKLHGDLVRSKGAIAALSGETPQALRDYLEAHRIFRAANEKRSQAIALQDIGQIYWEAGDYGRMLAYYDDAQEIYNEDPAFALGSNNNRGEAYRIMGRGADAERAYTAALANARAMQSPLLETRILSNLALVQAELGKLKQAARNADQAEKLGANPEARDWLPFVYGVKAAIAVRQGEDTRAATLLNQLFSGQDFAKTDLVYKEFHKLAADVFTRLKQPDLGLAHMQAFYRLDSEARDLTASASSQLLAAQFDSANQKVRISELKQGQLERDVKIARQRGTLATALLVAAFAFLIVVSIALFSIRKSRNEVRDANEVLTDVNEKLESALKAKTDFLAMTSHEIRTPLNGIMGMTQVILADERTDQETRERVKLVLGAGQTMQALVDDLLDVAKMQTGEIGVHKEPCNLREILSDCANLWRAEASAKGLDISLNSDDLPSMVFTDGGRVRQIIFNLLANAIKFTPQGSVSLSATGQGENIVITVEDSGIGIAGDQLALIFEPFHQVDNAMSRNFGGAGLGLSICRNIMTALGGTISVDSVVGRGTRFTLTLPSCTDARTGSPEAPDKIEKQGSRAVILDSNELRLSTLKALVGGHVDDSIGVKTFDEAWTWLETTQVSLIIVEAATPVSESGRLSALSKLIAHAKVKDIAVILLLMPDDEVSLGAAQALEPSVLLQKPIKASALVDAIDRVMATRPFQSVAA
jgi:signal transduction histidine kinase